MHTIKLKNLHRHSINKNAEKWKLLQYPADISLYYCGYDGEYAIGSQLRGWIMSREVVTQLTAVSPGVLGRLDPNRHFFSAYKL